jgi:hypothetical protein
VLFSELASLGLKTEAEGGEYGEEEKVEEKNGGVAFAEEVGAEIVATPELTADKGPMEVEEVVQS